MAAVKSLNSNYTITNKATPLANIIVATHTMFVDGNLLVGGNTTQVTKTELSISDNTITLNKGEVGSGVTLGTAGIEVDRGVSPNVSVLWNEAYSKWSLTNDGSIFANISTSTGVGSISLIDDPAPQLGGNLDVLNRTIFSSNTQQVKFDSNLAVKYETGTVSTLAGYNVIYAQTPTSGGSGLFVTNTTNADREVATTRKSIVYSLVL